MEFMNFHRICIIFRMKSDQIIIFGFQISFRRSSAVSNNENNQLMMKIYKK